MDIAVETDAASVLIASTCNSGAAIYAATWWRIAPATATTFTAHTARWSGSLFEPYVPIGTAVVSADLSTVTCGTDLAPITRSGPFVASAAAPLYIVTFERTQPEQSSILGPVIAVYPSTGVVPVNDSPSSPTVVGQLPFSATEDTTLATVEPDTHSCYNLDGYGPSVWYSYRAEKTGTLAVTTSGYWSQVVAFPVTDGVRGDVICDANQFAVSEGTTYLIGAFGFAHLLSVGVLTVEIRLLPLPGSPQSVVASPGDAAATVSWVAPPPNGGLPVTGYRVTSTPGGSTCSTTGASSCVVTGLTNGTAYTFTVEAINPDGTGPASAASAAVIPAPVPDAPSGVSGTAGDERVTVSWVAPASNNDAPVTSYSVSGNPSGSCSTAGALSCVVTGLTNGQPYTFTVRASNVIGTSPASSPSIAVTPHAPTVPGAPAGVVGVAGDGHVDVTWGAPASDGGSPIIGYQVTSSPGARSCSAFGALSCTVFGLTNGQAYTFTVRALNSVGTGPASSASGAVTPTAFPAGRRIRQARVQPAPSR